MACCSATLSGTTGVHTLIQDFFEWLGHALGTLIRFIVEALSGFFGFFADIGRSFLDGMAAGTPWQADASTQVSAQPRADTQDGHNNQGGR